MRLRLHTGLLAAMMLAAGAGMMQAQGPPPPDFPAMTKQAVKKSLGLIQTSATTFTDKMACFSCHHQAVSVMTFSLAKERGFAIDAKVEKTQNERMSKTMEMALPLLRGAKTSPESEKKLDAMLVDPAATGGYLMAGLEAGHQKPGEMMELATLYLARKQQEDGRWPMFGARPPHSSSEFQTTAQVIRALKQYGPKDHAEEFAQRIAKAREWLLTTPTRTTEDRAFKLFGLRWVGASEGDIQKVVQDILAHQEDDGGWSQKSGMASDAYATGVTLVALNQAGGLASNQPAYFRGAVWLLLNQQPDGSWYVKKRTAPAQIYFDAGFPHKESQFISFVGSSWATMALALVSEAPKQAAAK